LLFKPLPFCGFVALMALLRLGLLPVPHIRIEALLIVLSLEITDQVVDGIFPRHKAVDPIQVGQPRTRRPRFG
jgi:hypothetical protein